MFLVRRRPFTSKGTMLVLVAGSKMTVVGVVRSGWNFFFFFFKVVPGRRSSHAYLTNQIRDVRESGGRGLSRFLAGAAEATDLEFTEQDRLRVAWTGGMAMPTGCGSGGQGQN